MSEATERAAQLVEEARMRRTGPRRQFAIGALAVGVGTGAGALVTHLFPRVVTGELTSIGHQLLWTGGFALFGAGAYALVLWAQEGIRIRKGKGESGHNERFATVFTIALGMYLAVALSTYDYPPGVETSLFVLGGALAYTLSNLIKRSLGKRYTWLPIQFH